MLLAICISSYLTIPSFPLNLSAPSLAPRLAYLTDGLGSMALEANRAYRVRFWVLPTMMATEWYVATEHETGQLGLGRVREKRSLVLPAGKPNRELVQMDPNP